MGFCDDFNIYLSIYLAASGLCCGAWTSLQLWRVGFLFSSCGADSRVRGLCSCGMWAL